MINKMFFIALDRFIIYTSLFNSDDFYFTSLSISPIFTPLHKQRTAIIFA